MTSKSRRTNNAKITKLTVTRDAASPTDMSVSTDGLINAVANIPSIEEAIETAKTWARHQFDIAFGEQLTSSQQEVETLKAEQDRLEKELADLRREKKHTPPWVFAAAEHGDSNDKNVRSLPFSKWRLSHQIEALLTFFAFLLICYTSFAVTKANLTASGVPAFVDNSALAALIAAMPPAAALAIKSIGSIFWHAPHRAAFRLTVYLGAAVSFACWLWFFAHEYHGLSSEFDPFAEVSGSSALFTMLQLGSEVFVGAALFLRAERISEYYAPDFRVWNIEHDDLTKLITPAEKRLKEVRTELKAQSAEVSKLTAAREKLQLEIAVAVRDRKARFDG